jgi:hypothetical protein
MSANSAGQLSLNRGFVDAVKLEQIVPRPNRIDGAPQRIVLHFDVAQDTASTVVIIRFQPQAIGRLQTSIGVPGQPTVRLTQYVYP